MSGFATCMKHLLGIPAFVLLVIMFNAHAGAQEVDAPLDLDLPADANSVDMELDDAKSADYNSHAVGRRKRWQLDSGHIDSEAVTPRLRESDSDTSYSGIRLRRPRKY